MAVKNFLLQKEQNTAICFIKSLFLCLIFILFNPALNAASETQIKAVFLQKFTHLIEWPENSRSDFIICVLEDKPFTKELQYIYTNNDFRTKTVKIKSASANEPIPECDLLFIGRNVQNVSSVVRSVSKKPVLTVSDYRPFVKDNIMITMLLNQNRFKYIINNETAQSANIKISYLLLQTALEVIK